MTREEAIRLLKQWNPIHPSKKEAVEVAIEALRQPQIVRCKDCRFSLPSSENFIMCTAPYESQYPKAYKPIDWFCKGGERKDGDKE